MNNIPSRDHVQLLFLIALNFAAIAILLLTPGLLAPIVMALLGFATLSPLANELQAKGWTRFKSALTLFLGLSILLILFTALLWQNSQIQWFQFKEAAPSLFSQSLAHLENHETQLHQLIPWTSQLKISLWISTWLLSIESWFKHHESDFMSWLSRGLTLTPVLIFQLLLRGPEILRFWISLVPNRGFESFHWVVTQILKSLAIFIRAKLIQSVFMASLIILGLSLIHLPYSLLLGAFAGLLNILPYFGAALGLLPALFVMANEASQLSDYIAPLSVYAFAHLVDSLLIVPLWVNRKVPLHPLFLLITLSISQHLWGFTGLLLATPLAVSLKIIVSELHFQVYQKTAYNPWK